MDPGALALGRARRPGLGTGPSSPAPAESVPVDPARTGRRLRVDFRRLGVDCTLNGRLGDADEPGPVPFGVAFNRGKCSRKGHQRALSAEESERSVFHTGPRPIEAAMVHGASSVAKHRAATSKAAGCDEVFRSRCRCSLKKRVVGNLSRRTDGVLTQSWAVRGRARSSECMGAPRRLRARPLRLEPWPMNVYRCKAAQDEQSCAVLSKHATLASAGDRHAAANKDKNRTSSESCGLSSANGGAP